MTQVAGSTVAELAVEPLVVIAGAAGAERVVRGTHTSDLEHPARYLLPGEVLLTNGLWVDRVPAADWVSEAVAAGVVAIGFGLSERHAIVPGDLVAACEHAGLPLLEIPADVSFRTIDDRISAQPLQGRSLRVQLARLRRLTLELGRGRGDDAVLDLLRRETGLQGWVVGPGGRVFAGERSELDSDVARAAARAARRGEVPSALTPEMTAFGVHGGLTTTTLVVRAPLADVDDDARLLVEYMAAHVVLHGAQHEEVAGLRRALAQELIELLRAGDLGEQAFRVRLTQLGFDPERPLTAVATSADERSLIYAAVGCGATCVTALHAGLGLILAQSDSATLTDEIVDLLADGGEEPVVGGSRQQAGADGLRQALSEAQAAHRLAATRPPGKRVVSQLDPGSHTRLIEFLDGPVRAAFRSAVLGPLERWDREHQSQLTATLQSFLEHNGSWLATAEALHVHRNTLRYRLEKVAQLTGRNPLATEDRVDFALALAIADPVEPRPYGRTSAGDDRRPASTVATTTPTSTRAAPAT